MIGYRRVLMMLSAAVLLAGGCAHGKAATADDSTPEKATIRVTNNNWSDMTIYLLRGTERRRLGTVGSNSTGVFQLPEYVLVGSGDIRLLADPLGSTRTYLSPLLLVSPGQQVEWRLENNMSLSSAYIRS